MSETHLTVGELHFFIKMYVHTAIRRLAHSSETAIANEASYSRHLHTAIERFRDGIVDQVRREMAEKQP